MPTITESKAEPTSELSTSEQKYNPTSSELKPELTIYESKLVPIISDSKKRPFTPEITQYSIVTTPTNNPKTKAILTIILNHINLTSIASTEIKISTSIIENKIKTTIITEYGSATAIVVGLSNFLKYIPYFIFHIHF